VLEREDGVRASQPSSFSFNERNVMNKAKGKEALRARRERALSRRSKELINWIDGEPFGFNVSERQEKIDRASKDVKCLERKLGVKT
jgi:hypothetical protein